MKIVVNTRLLLKDRLEGIGWFTFQTLKRITEQHADCHFIFLFDRPWHPEMIFAENVTPVLVGPQARHPFLYFIWFQLQVGSLLKKLKPDLFLSPDGFLVLGSKCKQLPVIHDLNFIEHPKDVKWLTGKYYRYFFPHFAKEAKRIATVSEYSKNEIVKHYKIDPSKIDVIFNGINPFFRTCSEYEKIATRKKFANACPYFVSVGSLHPRKNIANLIRAFALFKKENACDHKLVLAGPHFWGLKNIYQCIDENKLQTEVIFTGRLKDEDLAAVVGAAHALTFIPYYEGFGIPLVEAMAAEIPILTSNVTSLPEVAGNAALLVDPHNVNGIKDGLQQICFNEQLRSDLIMNGRSRREYFSWDKSADRLWDSILKCIHT